MSTAMPHVANISDISIISTHAASSTNTSTAMIPPIRNIIKATASTTLGVLSRGNTINTNRWYAYIRGFAVFAPSVRSGGPHS